MIQFIKSRLVRNRDWLRKENNSTDFSSELIKQAITHRQEVASDRKLCVWLEGELN